MHPSNVKPFPELTPRISVEIVEALSQKDLDDLCDAADASIEAGGGFGWISPPERASMERYWHGVMIVPERHLIVVRMDGVVCGAVQLIEPSRHNEAQKFAATLLASFIAPWARNRGAGRKLIETTEKLSSDLGYKILQLDVRQTQSAAIALYEKMGYVRWGSNPAYALVSGRIITGYYYMKTLSPLFGLQEV